MMVTKIIFIIATLRVLVAILGLETSVLYARWYRITRLGEDVQIMRDLLLGITLVQSALLLFSCYGLIVGRVPRSPELLALYLVGDVMLTIGTMLHLRPAWRIHYRRKPSVILRFMARFFVATTIAALLVAFNFQ